MPVDPEVLKQYQSIIKAKEEAEARAQVARNQVGTMSDLIDKFQIQLVMEGKILSKYKWVFDSELLNNPRARTRVYAHLNKEEYQEMLDIFQVENYHVAVKLTNNSTLYFDDTEVSISFESMDDFHELSKLYELNLDYSNLDKLIKHFTKVLDYLNKLRNQK